MDERVDPKEVLERCAGSLSVFELMHRYRNDGSCEYIIETALKTAPLLARRVLELEQHSAKLEEGYSTYQRLNQSNAERVVQLEQAIIAHAFHKNDERCHLDDDELYAFVGIVADKRLPPKELFLGNCERYWECRKSGITYDGPEQRVLELEQENARLRHALCPDDSITEVSELEELAEEERQVAGNYVRHCGELEKQLAEARKLAQEIAFAVPIVISPDNRVCNADQIFDLKRKGAAIVKLLESK